MFSNFKLPSFLQRITSSSSQKKQSQCQLSSNSGQYQHSMERFYTEFAVIGQENKLKTVFTKKVASTFFSSTDQQQEQSSSSQQSNKAQIVYLKKKHASLKQIQTDKSTYDHLAFKIIFFEDKHEKQFEQRLNKQVKYKLINKKAVFSRNLQLPVNYYVQQVNSVCSRHKQVYVVFSRWAMGVAEKLYHVITDAITKNTQSMTANTKPFSYKQSTTNASKHSSTFRGVNSPSTSGYNYDQSLVNQLNFDAVKSSTNPLSESSSELSQLQSLIARELLIMIKCGIRSLQFLKQQQSLPNELNLASFLWSPQLSQPVAQGQVEKQVPQFSQHKKILTTLNNRFEINQSLAHESYLLANPSIPRQSMAELLKQTQPKAPAVKQQNNFQQTLAKYTLTLNQILSTLYPSPQELTQFHWQPESLYSSLLFKLGMTVLDVWGVYSQLTEHMKSSQKGMKECKGIKGVVYSNERDQDRTDHTGKINWLKVAQLLNSVGNPHASGCPQLVLLRKVLKLLLSRSAIERTSASSIVSSTQFISVISGKPLLHEHTLSKASSNRTQTSQQHRYEQTALIKQSSSNSQYSEFIKPISLSSASISPINLHQLSPRTTNHLTVNNYAPKLQQTPGQQYNLLLKKNNQSSSYNYNQQWQKSMDKSVTFDPRKAYFKVINDDFRTKSAISNANQTLSQPYSNYGPEQSSRYEFTSFTVPQYDLPNSSRTANQNSSFYQNYSHQPLSTTTISIPSSTLSYSSQNQSFPSVTPSNPSVTPCKQSQKQTVITQSISITYPSSSTSSYTPQHQYNSVLSTRIENSRTQQSSSPYYTPTFVQESAQKGYMVKDSIKESPKIPVKLFSGSLSSSSQVKDQLVQPQVGAQVRSYEIQRSYIGAHQSSYRGQHQSSYRDSPVYEPEFNVQISSSDKELPSYLPQSSNERINYNNSSATDQNSLNYRLSDNNILIQQDPQTSQKKSQSITQQLFASVKPTSQSTQLLSPIRTSNQPKHLSTNQSSHPNTRPTSSQPSSDPQQPRYVSQQYKGGGRYQGYTKNSKRHGYGRLDYHQGSRYQGDWLDDRMNGYGKLFYSNGNLAYEGYWVDDEFHGTGKVYNDSPTMLDDSFDYTNFNNLEEQWVHYEGQLKHDLKEGHGLIMLENGEWFEGEFHNDRINGQGKFVNLEGQIIYGNWKDNIMLEEYTN